MVARLGWPANDPLEHGGPFGIDEFLWSSPVTPLFVDKEVPGRAMIWSSPERMTKINGNSLKFRPKR